MFSCILTVMELPRCIFCRQRGVEWRRDKKGRSYFHCIKCSTRAFIRSELLIESYGKSITEWEGSCETVEGEAFNEGKEQMAKQVIEALESRGKWDEAIILMQTFWPKKVMDSRMKKKLKGFEANAKIKRGAP
jgi:hypothetical protein